MPRSAVACLACRERKSKCDGNPNDQHSQCSLCSRLDIECSFILNDARKWPSSKRFVRQLQDRIEILESKLKEKDKQQSSDNPATPATPPSTRASVSRTQPPQPHGTDAFADDSVADFAPENFAPPPISMTNMAAPASLGSTDHRPTSSAANFAAGSGAGDETPEFGREEVIKKFNGWKGQLKMDADGRTRFFGVTSDHFTAFEPEPSTDCTDADSPLSTASVLNGYGSFQETLLDLFWKNPHPFLRVPNREGFLAGLRMGRKNHDFSPFLLNCIILRSLHLTDSRLARKLEPGIFDRVKEQLFHELERPDHNTVLGLLFLATYVSGLLKSGLGWIYSGIAGRLLFALGLHQDLTPLLEAGRISRKELEYRQMILWSAYVNDSLWSVSLGRPGGIRHGDIVCPPISPLHSSPDMAQLAAWAELCTIQARVTDIHNGPQSRSSSDQVIQQLSALDTELTTWREELPDHLRWIREADAGRPGPVYALQLACLATTIVLHRPMAGFENSRAQPFIGGGARARTEHDAANSRQRCRSAALEIGTLLKSYTGRFAPNQIPTIFTRMSFIASTTLIFGILMTDPSLRNQTAEDRACIKSCLEVMGLMEMRFPSARHTRSVLLKILRNNNISLDDNVPEESPRSLDGEGEAAWKNLLDLPAFPLPSDLDWLYSANRTFDHPEFLLSGGSQLDMGLPHDFDPAQYNNFASTGVIDPTVQTMDLSGMTASTPAMHTGMTPGWPQNPMGAGTSLTATV